MSKTRILWFGCIIDMVQGHSSFMFQDVGDFEWTFFYGWFWVVLPWYLGYCLVTQLLYTKFYQVYVVSYHCLGERDVALLHMMNCVTFNHESQRMRVQSSLWFWSFRIFHVDRTVGVMVTLSGWWCCKTSHCRQCCWHAKLYCSIKDSEKATKTHNQKVGLWSCLCWPVSIQVRMLECWVCQVTHTWTNLLINIYDQIRAEYYLMTGIVAIR